VLVSRRFRHTLLLIVALPAGPLSAQAQVKLDASYTVTLAGIPIGKGDWTIEVSDKHYSAAATATATGLMRVLTGAHGTTNATGTFVDGQLVASTYYSTITNYKKTDVVRLMVSGGTVKEAKIDPPQDSNPERVPITEETQKGIIDPMSAVLMRVSGTGEVLAPEACQRTLPVFDGRIRYDLQLAFKRMEAVKADKGYAGPAVVCAATFTPIAGHIPSRAAIRYISKAHDIEVWLVPIAGTRVLIPFRVQGPTPIGPAVFEADTFVSTTMPNRASANGVKIQ